MTRFLSLSAAAAFALAGLPASAAIPSALPGLWLPDAGVVARHGADDGAHHGRHGADDRASHAKRGADDGAGHVRGGKGKDDGAAHAKRGSDDPAGHVRGGKGQDDRAGHDTNDDKGGKGKGQDDGAAHAKRGSDDGRAHGRHGDDDRASGSGRSKPRVPGGSGCDDPRDLIEHPECRG